MQDIRHPELNLLRLTRCEGLRFGQAITKLAAERLTADQLLITAHVHSLDVRIGVGVIVWVDIDSFTTKSESVPLVDTCSTGVTGPAIVRSSSSGSVS